MGRTLGERWQVTGEHTLFGHRVRVHQNGSAVILEVDGLCLVGDAVDLFGHMHLVFPRHLAICPTLDDAQRAVELAWRQRPQTPATPDAESSEASEVLAPDAFPQDATPVDCPHGDAVQWNPFNQVVQCHRCGQVFVPGPAIARPARTAPTVVCLCGSTRFSEAFRAANLHETLAGRIVLSIGCDMRSDSEIFGDMPVSKLFELKQRLDDLHKRKIDLADEILVLNLDGYIGESTRSEIDYAREHGKRIRYLDTTSGQKTPDMAAPATK